MNLNEDDLPVESIIYFTVGVLLLILKKVAET